MTETKVTLNGLKMLLSENHSVKFKFKKTDGTERVAVGTRNPKVIEESNWIPKNTKKQSDKVVCFYDIEIDEWRCLNKELNPVVVVKEINKEI